MFVQVNSFAIFRVPVIVCAHFAIEVVNASHLFQPTDDLGHEKTADGQSQFDGSAGGVCSVLPIAAVQDVRFTRTNTTALSLGRV